MTANTEGAVTDVAAIAAKLSKAQRSAIIASSYAGTSLSAAAMRTGNATCEALVAKSLFWRGSNRWTGQATYGPTETGIAVRNHLTEQGVTAS